MGSVAAANARAGYEKYETTASLGLDNIEFEVTIENFHSISKFFDGFPDAVERGIDIGMRRSSKALTKKLKDNLVKYGLGDSALMYEFSTTFDGTTLTLNIDSDYAIYVEMGTGIIGQNDPHPNQMKLGISWQYDVNDHGTDGWRYYDEDSKRLRWTAGQASRPYIYDTYKWAERAIPTMVKNDIKKEIMKLGVILK